MPSKTVTPDSLNQRRKLVHGVTPDELEARLVDEGFPRYRANQVWKGLYRQFAADWKSISGIPVNLQSRLEALYEIIPATALVQEQTENAKKQTAKILFELQDGERIETVIIPSGRKRGAATLPERENTVCVSTQVGCRFGCAFCASGKAGFVRNLEAGEIVFQVVAAARISGRPPRNIVFMGVGEPLDNYANVLAAIRIINHPEGLGIGARKITISTCGIVPQIMRLAEEGLQIELSVSLHALDNETRSELMPVNRKYPVEKLLEACALYSEKTGRIITFEYTLIKGVNDTPRHAEALAERLRATGKNRVNIIPLSPVKEFEHSPATTEATSVFMKILLNKHINATLRKSKGSNIDAACGQLRINRSENQ